MRWMRPFREMVWQFVHMAAEAHDGIWLSVKSIGLRVSDKDLHFWVFGLLGALLLGVSWLLFWLLRRRPGVAAFLFSLVTVALLALAVEMGQQISGTGAMELSDIAAGVAGFLICGGALIALVLIARSAGRAGGRSRRGRRR